MSHSSAESYSRSYAHLLRNPVNRRHSRRQQWIRIAMPAQTRATITNPGHVQMSLEKPIPNDEVADMRQTAFRVQKEKVQLVMSHRFVIPLNDVDRSSFHCNFVHNFDCRGLLLN